MSWKKTSFDALTDKSPDEIVELQAWDVLRVAPPVALVRGPDRRSMDVICIGGRKPARGDTEQDEAFWPVG